MKLQLHWQILISIILAVAVGTAFEPTTTVFSIPLLSIFEFLGTLFLNALKMVIVPLVLSSIICGMSGIGSGGNLGRLGGKTLAFYMISSLLAILMGLVLVNMIQPGIIDGEPAKELLGLTVDGQVEQKLESIGDRGAGDIAEVFLRMVPPNIVYAAAQGQMLGLIFFGILFGFFMLKIETEYKNIMIGFWQGIFQTMMFITMFVMKLSPYGVFGLVATTAIATDFRELMETVGLFFLTVAIALLAHALITMPILLKVLGRVNPVKQIKALSPAMLTAFSTASSSGTLPVTMECMEKNAGVSNKTTSFVLPLGATINMDGTALYECVAAMFIAQAYGLELSFSVQFTIVLIALLTSIGVAGIPSASLVAITVILSAVGLPLEGIGLLMITDRILDMMRTTVNVFSDSCCATVIARTEGEETSLQ